MPENIFTSETPPSRWQESIRKVRIIGTLAVKSHDEIEAIFEEEIQRRVDTHNLTPRHDIPHERKEHSPRKKLWRKMKYLSTALTSTYNDIIEKARDELESRISSRYKSAFPPVEKPIGTTDQSTILSDAQSNILRPTPARTPERGRVWIPPMRSVEALIETMDFEYDSPRPHPSTPVPNSRNRGPIWSQNPGSSPKKHRDLDREPPPLSSVSSQRRARDLTSWSWSVHDNRHHESGYGQALEEVPEDASFFMGFSAFSPLAERISEPPLTITSHQQSSSIPLTELIPRMYDDNVSQNTSRIPTSDLRESWRQRRRLSALNRLEGNKAKSPDVDDR